MIDESRHWENILQREWMPDIDVSEWFTRANEVIETPSEINIVVDSEEQSVTMHLFDWTLVWYMRPWCYTYGTVSSDQHIEKIIFPYFRGKGYGKVLLREYKKNNFYLPDFEYHHKPSALLFDQLNGYKVTHRIDDNGNKVEMSSSELAELNNTLLTLPRNDDSDLPYTYLMEKI